VIAFPKLLVGVKAGSVLGGTVPTRGEVRAFATSPDGTLMAVALQNGEIQVAETKTDRNHWWTPARTLVASALAFAPDAKRIAIAYSGVDPTVEVWDHVARTLLASFR